MQSEEILYTIVETTIGKFAVGATSVGCCLFEFLDRGGIERIRTRIETRHRLRLVQGKSGLIDRMQSEVEEYLAGVRENFSLPLDLKGTPFEVTVWRELLKIPYGATRSYGEVAAKLGKPGAARAVGRANGANCLAIIVPCHRVIQEDGSPGGYGGGLWRKIHFLKLEGSCVASSPGSQVLNTPQYSIFG